jgi:hypothetical protein
MGDVPKALTNWYPKHYQTGTSKLLAEKSIQKNILAADGEVFNTKTNTT